MGVLGRCLARVIHEIKLPRPARSQRARDRRPLDEDPGIVPALRAAIAWLCEAQDASLSADGGVARHFSLLSGWSASYPETTGYIVPTLLDASSRWSDAALHARARRMLDWLVSIQFPDGGFQGGTVDQAPRVPVTFNTGQILLGLAAGAARDPVYNGPMLSAARWLARTQDRDGAWRRHATPFAAPGVKVYETHVAWGLFEAARLAPGEGFAETAMANVRWALARQWPNGWFGDCCLDDPARPLTHTLGYVLRGVVEAYRFHPDRALLDAAVRCADGLLAAIRADGALPGRLDPAWHAAAPWTCLTGNAQIAHCWLLLAEPAGRPEYLRAAERALAVVRRTIRVDAAAPASIRGAIKGSHPVAGGYCPYEYPNWAAKFFVDAQVAELDIAADAATAGARATAS